MRVIHPRTLHLFLPQGWKIALLALQIPLRESWILLGAREASWTSQLNWLVDVGVWCLSDRQFKIGFPVTQHSETLETHFWSAGLIHLKSPWSSLAFHALPSFPGVHAEWAHRGRWSAVLPTCCPEFACRTVQDLCCGPNYNRGMHGCARPNHGSASCTQLKPFCLLSFACWDWDKRVQAWELHPGCPVLPGALYGTFVMKCEAFRKIYPRHSGHPDRTSWAEPLQSFALLHELLKDFAHLTGSGLESSEIQQTWDRLCLPFALTCLGLVLRTVETHVTVTESASNICPHLVAKKATNRWGGVKDEAPLRLPPPPPPWTPWWAKIQLPMNQRCLHFKITSAGHLLESKGR